MSRASGVLCAIAAAFASCQATSNPDRARLDRVAPAPKAAAEQAPLGAGATSASLGTDAANALDAAKPKADASPTVAAQKTDAASPATKASAAEAAKPAAAELSLGRIGDRGLEAREFLRRLWIADNASARAVLEQMVFARLTTLEADRLGVLLEERAVDVECARTVAALEKGLTEKGSKLSFDEHVDRVLKVDPKLYRASLRSDAIVQLLAERCVRAWMLESDRADVRITEIRSAEALAVARTELAAAATFDEVALAHGFGEDAATHATRMTLARAEGSELARLAFATPVGSVGGPLEQSGRWLLLQVDARRDALAGGWKILRDPVEASLVEEGVSNGEFLQWRAAMTRRYQVAVDAFFDIVEASAP